MKPKLIRITTVPISLRKLLQGQLRFMSNYYDVVAVSSDGDCFEKMLEEQGGIRGVKIEMTRKITLIKDLKALFKLIKLFRTEKPTIVHTHTPKAGIVGMLAAKISGVPIRLHTVAGMPLLEASGLKRFILNFIEKLTYACATNVYPNSFGLEKIIINQKLAHQKKLKVIANGSSNGIDTNYFNTNSISQSKAEIRDSLNIPQNAFVFVFVGRMVGDKGINELINAFGKLYATNKNTRLILVGPFEKKLDPLLPETEKTILTHESIKFMDFQDDVRPFFKAADALVFPSYREGFPNVVMQAGAMDLPSIVTDINGCNEIIVNNKNGIIIPPKNENELYKAMNNFINNQDKTKEMASVAREMITSRYEQQMVWQALLEEYKRLI